MHRISNPVQTLSDVLAHAKYSNEFSPTKMIVRNLEKWTELSREDSLKMNSTDIHSHPEYWVEKSYPVSVDQIHVVGFFPQTWSSTALGNDKPGTVAGQAFTTAYTIILQNNDEFLVYFGGRFCYKVVSPNELFFEHVSTKNMHPLSKHASYNRS